jgi:hypothetical protein
MYIYTYIFNRNMQNERDFYQQLFVAL